MTGDLSKRLAAAMAEFTPTPGRVVHFNPGGTDCLPATVAGGIVLSGNRPVMCVNLGNVLSPTGEPYGSGCVQSVPQAAPGERIGFTWHWPER